MVRLEKEGLPHYHINIRFMWHCRAEHEPRMGNPNPFGAKKKAGYVFAFCRSQITTGVVNGFCPMFWAIFDLKCVSSTV